jgi:hypothetical protein
VNLTYSDTNPEKKKDSNYASGLRKSNGVSINFGGYQFSDPVLLHRWFPPSLAGLYVILVLDLSMMPHAYKALYLGKTGDFAKRGLLDSHKKRPCWFARARTGTSLYVSTYLMPNSSPVQRKAIEQQLIAAYQPPCNF